MNPGDYFQSKNNKVFKKTTVYKFDKKALAQFLSDKRRDHLEYMNNEKKIGSSNSLEIIKKFKEKIKKEFKNIEKFNFKTLFLIKYANGKKFKLILDFQTKKAKLGNLYHNSKIDLKINIDSYKIKNLLNKRYPMNFLTFSNGGHICERPNLNLSSSEVKFWHWINNILF